MNRTGTAMKDAPLRRSNGHLYENAGSAGILPVFFTVSSWDAHSKGYYGMTHRHLMPNNKIPPNLLYQRGESGSLPFVKGGQGGF